MSSSHYSTSCPVLEFQSLQSLFPCPWVSVLGAVQSLQSLLPCPWVPVINNPCCPVLEFQSLVSYCHYSPCCPVLEFQSLQSLLPWSLSSSHYNPCCRGPWVPVISILVALSLSSSHYNPWCPVLFVKPWCRPVITILVALSLNSSHYNPFCPVLEFQSLQSLFPCSFFSSPWCRAVITILVVLSLCSSPWCRPVNKVLVALSLSSIHYNPCCPVPIDQSSLPGAVFVTGQRSARMAWVYVVNGEASALWSAIWYGLHRWTLKEMCTNLPKAKELGNRQVPFTILSCFNRHVQVYIIAFIY